MTLLQIYFTLVSITIITAGVNYIFNIENNVANLVIIIFAIIIALKITYIN